MATVLNVNDFMWIFFGVIYIVVSIVYNAMLLGLPETVPMREAVANNTMFFFFFVGMLMIFYNLFYLYNKLEIAKLGW